MSDGQHDDSDLRIKELLTERLAVTQERLKAVEAEAERLKSLVELFREVVTRLSGEAPLVSQSLFHDLPPTVKRPLTRMTIKEAARAVLENADHPVTVREIFDALVAGGRKVGGVKPTDTLRAILRYYEQDFAKTEDGKWTLNTSADIPDENEAEAN